MEETRPDLNVVYEESADTCISCISYIIRSMEEEIVEAECTIAYASAFVLSEMELTESLVLVGLFTRSSAFFIIISYISAMSKGHFATEKMLHRIRYFWTLSESVEADGCPMISSLWPISIFFLHRVCSGRSVGWAESVKVLR